MTGVILIAGLGRCGSSLLMQMLTAGGWPAVDPEQAPWPSFEHPVNNGEGTLPPDVSGVLKWLDPQRNRPPFERVRGSVFLTRDHKQQARSHLKFLRAVGVPVDGARWQNIAGSFRGDERRALATLRSLGPVMRTSFEALVSTPMAVLAEIAMAWPGDRMDIAAAAAQLRLRETGAAVLPYTLEERLLAEGQGPA